MDVKLLDYLAKTHIFKSSSSNLDHGNDFCLIVVDLIVTHCFRVGVRQHKCTRLVSRHEYPEGNNQC